MSYSGKIVAATLGFACATPTVAPTRPSAAVRRALIALL
jgi:hypothetical protein